MRDSRLARAISLLDDARSDLVDVVDDGGACGTATLRDFNHIDCARQAINGAIKYIQMATTPEPKQGPGDIPA